MTPTPSARQNSKIALIAVALLAALTFSGCETARNPEQRFPLETEPETTAETTLDPQSAWQATFDEAMAANPYDQWLDAAKADGEMPYEMYAEYLSFWKSEFRYTLQSAAPLFDDADEYRSWRNSMEEWLDASAKALQLEMTQMGSQGSKLEVIIPHCENVRQKTMDAKKFCYVMETQESPCEPESLTSFAWRWTLDELTNNIAPDCEAIFDEVLAGERTLRFYDSDILFEKWDCSGGQSVPETTVCLQATVDLDGDGIPERIVCVADPDADNPGHYLRPRINVAILHYADGIVYGYEALPFEEIYSDGTVFIRSYADIRSRWSFEESKHNSEQLCADRTSGETHTFSVLGETVTEAEYTDFLKKLSQEAVTWTPVTVKGDPFHRRSKG